MAVMLILSFEFSFVGMQVGRGSTSMGSSMEDEGFVIVNVPSPSSSGHQPR